MRKKLISSTIFPLQGAPGWYHLATIHRGLREFMHFIDSLTGEAYIEELTGGSLTFIEDEELFIELEQFLADNGVHHCQRVNLEDNLWRKHPLNKKFYLPSCTLPTLANITGNSGKS